MSERRQLALLLAGLLTLAAIGVIGASIFPEDCVELEQLGDLDLVFADAADALPLAGEDVEGGETLQALGEDLGIGPWRGAVALPADATVTRSEFGFFVVTGQDYTVLRPSIGIASASRGRDGLDVLPAGTSLALRDGDGQTGVYNGEYELDRCGQLPTDLAVRSIDRGFALVEDGAELALVTLSGEEVWRAPATDGAHLAEGVAVLGDGTELELRDLRDGEVLDTSTEAPVDAPVPWIHAVDDQLLLLGDAAVVPVELGTAGLDIGEPIGLPLAPGPVIDAVRTPGGVVALGWTFDGAGAPVPALATDRSEVAAALPATVAAVALHVSQDGHVGLLVEVDGQQALLVYGPDRA